MTASQYYAFAEISWFTTAKQYIAAVSTLNTKDPNVIGSAPFPLIICVSASVKSPSGPIQMETEAGCRLCSDRNSSKYLRACLLPPCKDAIRGKSNCSFRPRNDLGVAGGSISGNQGEPHCLIASIASCC